MKILGVKFKNINSLTGEWEIRFDRSPISDTGLFAIVGPNGSGKSSILDAITLGLYGKTPRLGNSEAELLQFPGTESFAEVTFSVRDHLFCSRWFLEKTGQPADGPDMALFSVNGQKTLVESRTTAVRTRIVELTGLDFKRFCRTILLAQGEFSAFLNALGNERAEILENIVGPEMVRELAESTRSRAEVENERLQRLKEEAAAFELPAKDRADEVRGSIQQARDDIREIERNLTVLHEQEGWLERMAREPHAREAAAEAHRLAQVGLGEARKRLEQVEQARPAGLFQEAFLQIELRTARAEELREEWRLRQEQVSVWEKRIEELEAQLCRTHEERQSAGNLLDSRMEDFVEAQNLEGEITTLSQEFLDTVARLEASMREQGEASRLRSDWEEREKALGERMEGLHRWLDAHPVDESLAAEIAAMETLVSQLTVTRQEVEARTTEKKEAQKAVRRSLRMAQRAEKAARKVRIKTQRLTERKQDRQRALLAIHGGATADGVRAVIEAGTKKLAPCKALWRLARKGESVRNVLEEQAQNRLRMETVMESLALEQSGLQALDGRIRNRDAVRRLETDRNRLEPGAPCPLCGSPVHPYVDEGPLDFTELDRTVGQSQERIRTLHVALDSLKAKDATILERVRIRDAMHREWDRLCALAGTARDFGQTDGLKEHVQTIQEEIRSAKSRLRSAWWVAWRLKWTDRSLGRKLNRLSRRESMLETARSHHEVQAAALGRMDEDLRRLVESEEATRSMLFHSLGRLGEPLPEPGQDQTQDHTTVARLKERSEAHLQNVRKLAAATGELEDIQARLRAACGKMREIEGTSRHLSDRSERIETRLNALKAEHASRFEATDPTRERRELESTIKRLEDQQRSLSTEADSLRRTIGAGREALARITEQEREARESAAVATKDLLERARANGFDRLEAIREELLILGTEPEVESGLADAERTLQTARKTLEGLRPTHPTSDSLDTVRWKIADGVERRQSLEQDIAAWQSVLDADRKAEREYRELLQAIAVQEKVYGEAEEACGDGGEGGRIGGKLHPLLLRQLLERANRHLSTLTNGRYTLRPIGPDDLSLAVEDLLQARALRSVSTLSGGESFLVSLCLALALSDMAARHHPIESLFLDEGFGNLDEEMLYKVISTLKALRANGRTVGVVSHVKRVAEEIPTRIRVEKDPGGTSRIVVVA